MNLSNISRVYDKDPNEHKDAKPFDKISWKEFRNNPLDILRIWDGGLVFYGAFISCALALWLFCRRHHIAVLRMLDLTAPYAVLAHAFGRIGCFLSGCCYGRPSISCLAVEFPSLGDHTARLPTQLFESVFNFALFFGLLFLRRHRRFQGQIFWSYLGIYAIGRFVIEIFRGDEIRGWVLVPWLHTSQLIALAGLAVAAGMLLFGPRPAVKPGVKAISKA